jgi:hypothetical protein
MNGWVAVLLDADPSGIYIYIYIYIYSHYKSKHLLLIYKILNMVWPATATSYVLNIIFNHKYHHSHSIVAGGFEEIS